MYCKSDLRHVKLPHKLLIALLQISRVPSQHLQLLLQCLLRAIIRNLAIPSRRSVGGCHHSKALGFVTVPLKNTIIRRLDKTVPVYGGQEAFVCSPRLCEDFKALIRALIGGFLNELCDMSIEKKVRDVGGRNVLDALVGREESQTRDPVARRVVEGKGSFEIGAVGGGCCFESVL
ncbi:hypothetical protein HG531_010507 [Fusarium graminearum]|nr:hypothetical protein HG531_010507 [Fusarium graminearum]